MPWMWREPFRASGDPVPQGSMKYLGHRRNGAGRMVPIIQSDNPGLHPWRDTVALTARIAIAAPMRGPIGVRATFALTRPEKVPPGCDEFPATKPDADKLLRAILDAITGIAFVDDKQVVYSDRLEKVWAGPDGPGATIQLAWWEPF